MSITGSIQHVHGVATIYSREAHQALPVQSWRRDVWRHCIGLAHTQNVVLHMGKAEALLDRNAVAGRLPFEAVQGDQTATLVVGVGIGRLSVSNEWVALTSHATNAWNIDAYIFTYVGKNIKSEYKLMIDRHVRKDLPVHLHLHGLLLLLYP